MKYYTLVISILTYYATFDTCWLFAHTSTKTPIKHVVVIFQENRTFDHYFGTYPNAENNHGDIKFHPRKNTPSVNGLTTPLLTNNQNSTQPFRLARSQANTAAPIHEYTPLQEACHAGLMDNFVQTTGNGISPSSIVMGYFDGNTVTALWNYAQYFAMSDNFRSTVIGASTAGALNLISGQTHGATPSSVSGYVVDGTLINDLDPTFDNASVNTTVQLSGTNVGNLLNDKGITWGWFQGGFKNTSATHNGPSGNPVTDYIPHHNPFQYYSSTSNQNHTRPSSYKKVGKQDSANHNYDIEDFWKAAKRGVVPAVSFFKAPAYQDGHAGYSDPVFEQHFLVKTINRLQKLPQWKNMAIIIAYDDAGGWYDHEPPQIVNDSQISDDAYVSPGNAGSNTPMGGYQGRPGYGQRLPFLVISPWAKENYVDHTLIDQSSVLKFIEYNWNLDSIGDYSYDSFAGSIVNMFDFKKRNSRYLLLHYYSGKIKKKG